MTMPNDNKQLREIETEWSKALQLRVNEWNPKDKNWAILKNPVYENC